MKLKRISKKVAREEYGVLTGGVNSMYDYYLREDGCVVDSGGDRRYIPPYEDGMYNAEVKITDANGKEVEYSRYSKLLECAKADAIRGIEINSHGCAHGELHISLVISKSGEYVDSDEWFADWNGKTVTAKEDVV
ncbi:MAG: hypothetical protein NC489_42485 [Ruminococcus flavefaciens]|nr:hypothetical protein [Ruminococcus flavefaciens]